LEASSDHLTQSESIAELQEHLRDSCEALNGGNISLRAATR